MHFILNGHNEVNAVQTMIQVFYPNEKYIPCQKPVNDGITIESGQFGRSVWAKVFKNSVLLDAVTDEYDGTKAHLRRQIKHGIFTLLVKETGIRPPWGLLTGIRPAKVVNQYIEDTGSESSVLEYLLEYYLVEPKKAALAIAVAKSEREITKNNDGLNTALYVGIPFCPSKCLYCSFTSYPLNKYSHKVPEYIASMAKEMAYAKEFLKGRHAESVYIGGGTPTSLSPAHFKLLLDSINQFIDVGSLREFTVEAGRPDTITEEVLKLLRDNHVSRIAINPQTMNDETLKNIGRKHTVDDFLRAFYLARNMGFHDINVDLILGLPGEGLNEVEKTLVEISALQPESITIHTLSIKRASRLKEEVHCHLFPTLEEMDEMIELSRYYAESMGMHPYYMYRQKNMLGNFENVGYCLPGYESLYNVQIMEEKQNVIGIGCGATTKYVNLASGLIKRAFNVKEPGEYIERIDEMIQRKRELEEVLC